jgi:hypothetical protein
MSCLPPGQEPPIADDLKARGFSLLENGEAQEVTPFRVRSICLEALPF